MSTRANGRLLGLFLLVAALLAYSSWPKALQYVRLSVRVSAGQAVLTPEGLLSLEAMRTEVAKVVLHTQVPPDLENLKVSWKLQKGLVVRVGGTVPLDVARKMQDHYRAQWLARLDELRIMHQDAHRSAPVTARTIWQARFQASDPQSLRARQRDIEGQVQVLEWQIRQPGASLRGRSQEEADAIRSSEALWRDELRKKKAVLSTQLLNPAQLRQAEIDFRGKPEAAFVMPKFAQLEVEVLDRQARQTYPPGPLWPPLLGLGLLAMAAAMTFQRYGSEQNLAPRVDPS